MVEKCKENDYNDIVFLSPISCAKSNFDRI